MGVVAGGEAADGPFLRTTTFLRFFGVVQTRFLTTRPWTRFLTVRHFLRDFFFLRLAAASAISKTLIRCSPRTDDRPECGRPELQLQDSSRRRAVLRCKGSRPLWPKRRPSAARRAGRTVQRRVQLADHRKGEVESAPTATAAHPVGPRDARSGRVRRAHRVCAGAPLGGGPRGCDELRVKARGVERPVALPPDLAGPRLEVEDRDVGAVQAAAAPLGQPAAQAGGMRGSRAGEDERDVEVRRRLGVEARCELDGERRDAWCRPRASRGPRRAAAGTRPAG